MITFQDPWFLLFLAALPLLFLINIMRSRTARSRAGEGDAVAFPALDDARAAGATWRTRTVWLPAAITAAGTVLLITALARPVLPRAEIPVLSEGVDIVVVVDLSSSMGGALPERSSDNAPSTESPLGGDSVHVDDGFASPPVVSTLDAVREPACRFIRSRTHDRIAVVGFARTPGTLCPFTLDQDAAAQCLAAAACVEPDSEEDGTAIGAALAEAARLLDGSRAGSRAVVLFTDGMENRFAIDPLIAARLCADLGVRVHAVVLDFCRAPERSADAEAAGAEPLDDTLHRRIAAITGGVCATVRGADELVDAMRFIDGLEKTVFEGRSVTLFEDLFRWALLPGFGLLLSAFALRRAVYGRVP